MSRAPESILRLVPPMEFMANSTDENDPSGVATWRYVDECNDAQLVRVEFASFKDAHEINTLIERAYRAGKRRGQREMSADLQRTLKGYAI